jgi:hypothetical protein
MLWGVVFNDSGPHSFVSCLGSFDPCLKLVNSGLRMDLIAHHDEYGLQYVADVIARIEGTKFQTDFDAIPHGQERFRTVHFGWVYFGDEGSLISVSTNSANNEWEISVRGLDRSAFIEFRNGYILGCEDDGDVLLVGEGDDISVAVAALLDAAREAGMSDFNFSGAAARPEPALV